jgi:hypothetical protein
MKYGELPICFGQIELETPELMFVQDMPIKMAKSMSISIPENLRFVWPLLDKIYDYDFYDYIYLNAKHTYIPAGVVVNRPGWHSDGFGTDDVNYIWSDSVPTQFCHQEFNLSDDHVISMQEMEQQAKEINIYEFQPKSLLRLSPEVIHRAGISREGGFRIFIKITVSKNRFNLEGNAHNYLFDYDWNMRPRSHIRNDPGEST